MADNPTCATCRWWETESSSCPGVFGSCRLRAPIRCGPVDRSDGHPYPGWPPTSAQDWCGEHAPRVEARRCRMHPDRITDGALFCGYPLCGDCWTEEIIAEQDGVLLDFKKKILNGPEPTDAR